MCSFLMGFNGRSSGKTNLSLTKPQIFTENRAMKKEIVKGLSIFCLSMGLSLAFGGGSEKYSLYQLDQLYAYCQGNEGDWPRVLENTKEAVLAMLADEAYEPSNTDLMAVNSFCCGCNYYLISWFMKSKFYNKAKHDECLKNLFRLSHKMACMFEMSQEESIKMKQYKVLMEQQFKNDKNLLNVVNATPFSELAKLAAGIIQSNIAWGE